MTLSTQPYKGARDFYPEDKRIQNFIFDKWRSIVEVFGYEEYDAPILEPLELFLAKSSEEILKDQTYVFEDRGGRKVVIRPEMTPTVSRLVAGRRQELSYPLRWYSIPNLWRYERPQRGRLREHWQLNVDLFGVEGLSAEHEVIEIANDIMKSFGAKPDMYTIKINSRKLINYILTDFLGIEEVHSTSLIRLIDHIHKIETEKFEAAVLEIIGKEKKSVTDELLMLLNITSLDKLPKEVSRHESVVELTKLFQLLDKSQITNYVFDPTLMRGFDYYTDIVFEVFDTNTDNNRSMFGGGRYDGLVGLFDVDPIPTVGFGMGDVTLQNFLEVHNLMPNLGQKTDLYVVLIGEVHLGSLPVLSELRKNGLNVAVDSTGNKLDKQIKSAVKKGVNHVLFIGSDELSKGEYKLRNLKTGSENSYELPALINVINEQ